MKIVPESIDGTKKHRIIRPDGTDIDRYKNLEKWSYRKWAWEFLRRNDEFKEECKSVDSGTDDDKQKVANNYGLKAFKRYTESYKGGNGTPKFTFGAISSWTNLDCENENTKRVGIRIREGQVLIRFDLASAIEDRKIIEKQIRLATGRINKRMSEYEKIIKQDAKLHKFKAMNFGIYIRLLDYLAVNKSPLECAKLIYPKKGKYCDDKDLERLVKDPIKASMNMASEGYRYLSILKGSPKGKGILLGG